MPGSQDQVRTWFPRCEHQLCSDIPSGKTTLAKTLEDRLQARAEQATPNAPITAQAVSLDGFHFTREELDAMPDPATAHARRGAAFTFDADKYLDLIIALANPATTPILAPTFDHAHKDPRENDLYIGEKTRIIIVEGNYLALDEELWRDARDLFDEMWFVEVDFEVARRRLRERHLRAGIVQTLEEGDKRAMENDLPNGRGIVEKLLPVDEVIQSREDQSWVHN